MLQPKSRFIFCFLMGLSLTLSLSCYATQYNEDTPLLEPPTTKPSHKSSSGGRLVSKRLEIFADDLKESLSTSYNLSAVEELVLKSKKEEEGSDVVRQNLTPVAMQFIISMPQLRLFETNDCNISVGTLRSLQAIITLERLKFSYSYLGSSVRNISPLVNLTELNLEGNELTDDELKVIQGFKKLVILNLSYNHINGRGLSFINQLKNLRKLNLAVNELQGQALENVQNIPSLTELDLKAYSGFFNGKLEARNFFGMGTFSPLQHLTTLQILKAGGVEGSGFLENLLYDNQEIPTPLLGKASNCLLALQLVELDVFDAAVDDESLQSIGQIISLRRLNLGTSITPHDVPPLIGDEEQEEKEIQASQLQYQQQYKKSPRITGSGLKYLAGLENLVELSLSGQRINIGAIQVGRLSALRVLGLKDCDLTDNDISALGMLSNLTFLDLRGNKIIRGTMHLTDLTNLQTLDLRFNREYCECYGGGGKHIYLLEDESVLPLSNLVALINLRLGTNRLTPKSIDSLKQLTHLKNLEIFNKYYYYASAEQKRKKIASLHKDYERLDRYGDAGTYERKWKDLRCEENKIEREKTVGVFPEEALKRLQEALPNCKIEMKILDEKKERNSSNACCGCDLI